MVDNQLLQQVLSAEPRSARAPIRLDLDEPVTKNELVPALSRALVAAKAKRRKVGVQAVALPEPATFSLLHEAKRPIELTLPFGFAERQVSAATFKALAGRSRDNLFRKDGPVWQFVENAEVIDLDDKSVLYRLGRVEIFS